jgi:hypothetical protein
VRCHYNLHIFRCDTAPENKYCDGLTRENMRVKTYTSITYCDACLERKGISCGYKKRYLQDVEEEEKEIRERCGTRFEDLPRGEEEGRKEKGKYTEEGERAGEGGCSGEREASRAGERSDEGQQFGKGKQLKM